MLHRYAMRRELHVALLAEGVDRNQIGKINGTLVGRRPPRGGRG